MRLGQIPDLRTVRLFECGLELSKRDVAISILVAIVVLLVSMLIVAAVAVPVLLLLGVL